MNCSNCQKETENPKFCSRSCAAIVNNKISQKRKMKNRCKKCTIIIRSNRTYCKQCKHSHAFNNAATLGEIIYKNHHKSSAYALVRTKARAVIKKLGITKCQNCNYCKHVEVAHKIKISSFPLDTLVDVINRPSNLLALCPNCHWELDHSMLEQSALDKLALIVN